MDGTLSHVKETSQTVLGHQHLLFQLFIFLCNVNCASFKKIIRSLIVCVSSTEPGIQNLFTFLYFVISQSNFNVDHSL
jgi:hypothetical protein